MRVCVYFSDPCSLAASCRTYASMACIRANRFSPLTKSYNGFNTYLYACIYVHNIFIIGTHMHIYIRAIYKFTYKCDVYRCYKFDIYPNTVYTYVHTPILINDCYVYSELCI